MLDLFIGLKRLIKRRIIYIDNSIFRLHWQLTSILLIAFSIVITTRQYVGNPIDCMQKDDIPAAVLNTFCWIHSTFAIISAFNKTVGLDVPHPGIDNSFHDIGDKKFYSYYQWVCFALFIQGIVFYIPYYLWKMWEGGMIRSISMGMQIAIISDEEKGHKKRILLEYLINHIGQHRWYALKYFLCESLSLVNLVLQFHFLDWFFDGEFMTLGVKAFKYAQLNQIEKQFTLNPTVIIFPRMTKCTFHNYGYSGDIEKHDALCMLPLNVVNEKIYIFLWFWFWLLGFMTSAVIVYRIFILMFPSMRSYFLCSRCRLSSRKDLTTICMKGNIGDWFILYMLGHNLDPIVLREITTDLGRRIRNEEDKAKCMKEIRCFTKERSLQPPLPKLITEKDRERLSSVREVCGVV